ncbi:vWA domain-containing protein [Hydrogenimonas urashimensis]|uniref:vWA domain-containing protein n=1 Tax=Hydrogenimonas urashimensis TaxID=2740515 RepID=UPI0019152FAB|nr:VWA-like domain-containing protein [Hydrogenimonas urashimensis]
MNPEEKIARAKTRLVVRNPWFGLLASRLKMESSDEVEAFLSDGRVLQYNDEWIAEVPVESVEFALANSVMHHVLSHENRKLSRQGWLWQLATDYAINDLLAQNGFHIPEGARFEARFSGMYAEAIYAVLKDEIKNEEYNDDESNEEGFNEQNRNRQKEQAPSKERKQEGSEKFPLPPQELEPALEEMWANAMQEALKRAKDQGKTPAGLERLFEKGVQGSVDWRSELYQAIHRHLKSDYTYARPNRKALAYGIYLPSTTSERLTVTVAIDSSGSVDEKLLGLFMGELEAMMLSFPDAEVDLLVCDAKIQGIYRFRSGEVLDFTLKGGGGTDFRPVFETIDKELPQTALLIYFTDGEGRFPETEPFYDTIWVLPEEKEVPFGKRILLNPHVV